MGQRGPRPLPRNADGTKRKTEIQVIGGLRDLEPSASLPPHVQDVWRELVEPMRGAAILDIVDAPALEAMSRCVARWRMAEAEVDRDGPFWVLPTGHKQAHPGIAIAQKAQAEYRSWCARFGLTPSDRVGLGMAVIRGKSLAQDLADKIGPSPRVAG